MGTRMIMNFTISNFKTIVAAMMTWELVPLDISDVQDWKLKKINRKEHANFYFIGLSQKLICYFKIYDHTGILANSFL